MRTGDTTCDLCGAPAGYGSNAAETNHKVKGKTLVLRADNVDVDLCSECLSGILADGRIMPVTFSNRPFFTPGLVLGAFLGALVMRLLIG